MRKSLLTLGFVTITLLLVAVAEPGTAFAQFDDRLAYVSSTPDPAEERLRRANERMKTGAAAVADLREIMRDPAAAAREAIARNDMRLVNFETRVYFDNDLLHPTHTNIYCSIPSDLLPVLTRSHLILLHSDVVGDPPAGSAATTPPLDALAAIAYNRMILGSPRFPHADICVEFEILAPNGLQSTRAKEAPLPWARLSVRPALQSNSEDGAIVQARNGLPTTSNGINDRTDVFGMTELAWTAARGAAASVNALLRQGGDPWFGNYCSLRRNGKAFRAAIATNYMNSPLWIAITGRRESVANAMIAKAPLKNCTGDPSRKTSPLSEQLDVVQTFASAAKEQEIPNVQRKLLVNYLSALQPQSFESYLFKEFTSYAFESGQGALFEATDLAYLAQGSVDFLKAVAFYASPADLERWRARLGPVSVEATREIITSVHVDDRGDASARSDFLSKLTSLVATTRNYSADDKAQILRAALGHGLMMARIRDDQSLNQQVVAIFEGAAYELSASSTADGCTPLLRMVSYSGECNESVTAPLMARALIVRGVELNAKNRAGMTALDLASARAGDGPYPEAFAKVVEVLRAAGAKRGVEVIETTAPPSF